MVIGAEYEVAGYALVGAQVLVAHSTAEVIDAWQRIPADTCVVIVTKDAAAAAAVRADQEWPMVAVMR